MWQLRLMDWGPYLDYSYQIIVCSCLLSLLWMQALGGFDTNFDVGFKSALNWDS